MAGEGEMMNARDLSSRTTIVQGTPTTTPYDTIDVIVFVSLHTMAIAASFPFYHVRDLSSNRLSGTIPAMQADQILTTLYVCWSTQI